MFSFLDQVVGNRDVFVTWRTRAFSMSLSNRRHTLSIIREPCVLAQDLLSRWHSALPSQSTIPTFKSVKIRYEWGLCCQYVAGAPSSERTHMLKSDKRRNIEVLLHDWLLVLMRGP